MYLLLYLLALAALAVHAPDVVFQPGAREFFIILGVVGAWRYGWGAVHLVRSLFYRLWRFPRWRRWVAAQAAPPPSPAEAAEGEDEEETPEAGEAAAPSPRAPSEVFIVVTSFRIPSETTALSYRAAIREAIAHGRPATIVASIVEAADQRLIKAVFFREAPPPHVRLTFVRLPGRGKRDALAIALRAVSRARPAADAVVVVMDGDTILRPGTLGACIPFFAMMPDVGGLTTDQDGYVAEGGTLIRAWHRLRFAQRHLLMSSMALSGRLLTMTGRMSMYRVGIATDPTFVDLIQNDYLDHWRLGRFRLLTGEDKSTWLWLLERGWRMLYVPDVRTLTVEHPPGRYFLTASTSLMLRWFGNMLRTSRKALALGPGRIGLFTWWCLVDQRLSMWTPLVGPTVAVLYAIGKTPVFLYAYLLWIMSTRLVQTLLLLTARERVSGLYPILIYYGQIWGAMIKTYMLFRLDRQRWTRQNIVAGRAQRRFAALGSAYVHGLAVSSLVIGLAWIADVLPFPPASALFGLLQGR